MMFNTQEVIGRIEEKVKFLAEKLGEAEQRNELLKEEIVQLRHKIENLESGLAGGEPGEPGEHKRSLAQTGAGGENAEKLKQEIDHYISDIDECIALLKEL